MCVHVSSTYVYVTLLGNIDLFFFFLAVAVLGGNDHGHVNVKKA